MQVICAGKLMFSLILVLILQQLVQADQVEDQSFWWTADDREYFIYNGSKLQNFVGARKICTEFSSHLATIETYKAHICLVELIEKAIGKNTEHPYKSFYIGLKDFSGGNANFQWDNGNMLHFIPGIPMQWAEGEPNNFNRVAEDCVTMGSSSSVENYKWFDVPCHLKRSYICQRRRKDVLDTDVATTPEILTSVVVFVILAIVFMTIFQQRTRLHRRMSQGRGSGWKVMGWFVGAQYLQENEADGPNQTENLAVHNSPTLLVTGCDEERCQNGIHEH